MNFLDGSLFPENQDKLVITAAPYGPEWIPSDFPEDIPVTTEAQIRDQMGKPETERQFTDGSKRFEYPRGPQGLNTYMVDIGPDGTLQAITQVLTAANFAKIRAGMTEDEVRRLLGKPGEVAVYPLKPETVWSWKWREGGVTEEGFFNVHFDVNHVVYTTSRSDVMRGH